MPQLGFRFDLTKCTGCHSCAVSCVFENNLDPFTRYRRVMELEGGAFPNPTLTFVSMACNHCSSPACVRACPVKTWPDGTPIVVDADHPDGKAMNKLGAADGGQVVIDQDACVGCRYCEAACPYGAPQYNELTQKVEKCHLCLHRTRGATSAAALVTGNSVPACVANCVGDALSVVEAPFTRGSEPPGYASPSLTDPSAEFTR